MSMFALSVIENWGARRRAGPLEEINFAEQTLLKAGYIVKRPDQLHADTSSIITGSWTEPPHEVRQAFMVNLWGRTVRTEWSYRLPLQEGIFNYVGKALANKVGLFVGEQIAPSFEPELKRMEDLWRETQKS